MDCSLSGSSVYGNFSFSGTNTGVGCHFFFQKVFPTRSLNSYLLCLLHCRQILHLISHRVHPSLAPWDSWKFCSNSASLAVLCYLQWRRPGHFIVSSQGGSRWIAAHSVHVLLSSPVLSTDQIPGHEKGILKNQLRDQNLIFKIY